MILRIAARHRHGATRTSGRCLGAALLALCLGAGVAFAQKPADKPRVPPGRDPGGVAVAIIGGGIDYTQPEIAARLARDGEGEIVGWDTLDNDRRPLGHCRAKPPGAECTMAVAQALLREAPASRLVYARASISTTDLIAAVSFAGRTPARIALLTIADPTATRILFLSSAADHFPHVLFIGPIHGDTTAAGMVAQRNNMLLVADAHHVNPPDSADLSAPSDGASGDGAINAAARIAALAARVLAREPGLDANALRQRIIGLARPPSPDVKARSRYGWIADPQAR